MDENERQLNPPCKGLVPEGLTKVAQHFSAGVLLKVVFRPRPSGSEGGATLIPSSLPLSFIEVVGYFHRVPAGPFLFWRSNLMLTHMSVHRADSTCVGTGQSGCT
jgi:hypothetical protein